MSDTPLTTIGDEALEARIVAWVLGEASAFESAELERLCNERAELMIFKRRMAALHKLLAEAEIPQSDASWKLPPAKRKAIEELLHPLTEIPQDTHKDTRIRFSARRTLLAIAACLLITVIILGLASPLVMRQSKKASRTPERQVAMQRELAAMEGQDKGERMKLLRPDFPPEQIEGTPKPIVLPRRTASQNDSEIAALADSDGRQSEVMHSMKEVNSPSHKPSAPTASMSKVLGASTIPGNTIPVPEEAVAESSLDFGNSDNFGTGWGDSGGGSPADGLRSGGQAVTRDSIDSVLSDEQAGGFKEGESKVDPVGEAKKLRKLGRYDEARSTLQDALGTTSADPTLNKELAALDDPVRTNPAFSFEQTQNVDKVRRGLYVAEGNYNLGKYDDAKREYENVLRTDPYNKVARRGLEQIASAKSDYSRAAYDHTRAELLSEVDKAWELAIPAEKSKTEVAREFQYPTEYETPEALTKAIREQEDKVEERRKVLATIVRTKGIVYNWNDSYPDKDGVDEIQEGIDTQDYLDAKTEFKIEQALLQAMKSKLGKVNEPESKPDLTKLTEEISASEDPYSTFSLNISDASFRIAQAALAKGERPDPAGIKVEQFYNAVNYGDPAPAAGEPVACAIEQAAHPVIPGRNLVRVALKTAAAGRSAAQPLRLTLLVDQSGSMSRADRRDAMDAAMRSLGTLLTDKDLVTVIGFSRTTRLLADGMKGDEVAQKLAGLVNQLASEGGTNLEEAIKLAEQMAMRRKLAGAQNRIVLFTDGAANLGDADPQRLAAKVEQLRQQGIAFDIAGIAADDLNDELLAELARKGNGRYSVVGKGEEQDFAKQLAGAFRPAAENVKVQVRFNPERVARYKLIGFEKDRLKTEDFRNDAVDAAELAAEEAGVAIYQVEPLPDGRGEIGEVSVRFRDTSSGEMVERMWTMSYNPYAPPADRATPSMQLAVLSMLAGEKLKGGPLADAIDFKILAQAQAAVKQVFGQDARVAEMLRMVDALK